MLKPVVRVLLLVTGTLAVALGVIGIFLPLLPTTPFLLLAAACYARSCESCHAWLLRHRWFGGFIRNWQEKRGITRRQKTIAIALLWAGILASATLAAHVWWVKLVLLGIATATTLYLVFGLRTLQDSER